MDIVTIKYHDEAFIKILCEPGIAQEIADHFTFDVPGAKFMPAYRNRMWDGKLRLMNRLTCLLYAGLIDRVKSFCDSRNYEVRYEGIEADNNFSLIEAKKFASSLNLKYEPREYQLEAFTHAVRKRRALLLSPTASGKSLMIYLLARYYDLKTLVVVPTTSLVHQMKSDFEDYGYPKDSVHQIMAGVGKNTEHAITVATWQSIYKQPKSWFEQFDVVIGDEAHLFKAKSLITIMTSLSKCKYRFGFTGTLDGTSTNEHVLAGLFGAVKRVTTTSQLIEQNFLSKFDIKVLTLKYPETDKKNIASADYQKELDFIVTDQRRNKFLINLALSLKGNTLLLFQYVDKQGKPLYNSIKAKADGKRVFFISGEVAAIEREKIRKAIEDGANDSNNGAIIVASFGTSSTGINIPSLHNIIFASPSKSRVRNLQSIGRVLRKSDSKVHATLYDVADDLSWKSKQNHTMRHLIERIKIYASEQFEYKIYNISI